MFLKRLNIYWLWSVLFMQTCRSAPEPLCSKFSYVEQLLEKMIRMEFNVQTMEKNMMEAEKRMQESETRSLDTQKFVTNVVGKVDDKIKKMEETEAIIIANITKALTEGTVRHERVVAFHAQQADDKSLVNNQVIVFTKVNMNEGSGYDNAGGYFTAPVGGIFHFTSHLCGENGKSIDYVIVVNDKTWASGLFTSNGTGRCSSVSVTVRMRSGERAWVTIDRGGSSTDLLYEDSDDWNYFSGFLIHELD